MYYALLLEPGSSLGERLEKTPKLPNTVVAKFSYKDTTGRAYKQEAHVSIGIVYLDPEAGVVGIGINPVLGDVRSFWQIVPRVMIEAAANGLSGNLIPTSFTKALAAAFQRPR